jgi:hypothetical protein
MPKKRATTIVEQRRDIARRYKRGTVGKSRKARKIDDETQLDADALSFKKAYAVFLKASDFPYSYISDNLGVTRGLVKRWFEDEKMQENVREVQDDILNGAYNYIKTYAIEAVEGIAEVGRKSPDWKVSLQAWSDLLDRMGLTKVNKSESVQTRTDEQIVTLGVDEEMLEKIEALPEETQDKIAELTTELQALVEDARGKG